MLQGLVTLQPKKPSVCVGRHYHRLNEDYRLLHTLCRFFLEKTGPSFERGDWLMSPFLVNMAQLYESFVAQWLKARQKTPLLQDFDIKCQDKLKITDWISYKIDLVLQDRRTGKTKYVLDTKYKNASLPTGDDIQQVVTYTLGKGCHEAILVYPSILEKTLDQSIMIHNIRIRPLTFSLEDDLEKAGEQFLEDLLKTELR